MIFRSMAIAPPRQLKLKYSPSEASEQALMGGSLYTPLAAATSIAALVSPAVLYFSVPTLAIGVYKLSRGWRGSVRFVVDHVRLVIQWPQGARHGTQHEILCEHLLNVGVQVSPHGGFAVVIATTEHLLIDCNNMPTRASAVAQAKQLHRFLWKGRGERMENLTSP